MTPEDHWFEYHKSSTGVDLPVFLCHASEDKSSVRSLYRDLKRDGFHPWLDEEDILPGQEWAEAIRSAVCKSGAVVVCLSATAVTKEGYIHKEIRLALDLADEKPEGMIFLIPLRLEECGVPPRLRRWQWVDLFRATGYQKLVSALRARATQIQTPRKIAFDRQSSSASNEAGRQMVQDWGKRMSAFGRWDWRPLFGAAECYQQAIERDPTFQHPWTNLAYVLHLMGEAGAAQSCLDRSRHLASRDSMHPGENHCRVEQAITNATYLSGGHVHRPVLDGSHREWADRILLFVNRLPGHTTT